MENKNNTVIYQLENGKTKINLRLESENVWMTQKSISSLFQKSITTINEHIRSIFMFLDKNKNTKYFSITLTEGPRRVKRKLIYYNFDVIFNVAIRCQCFEEFNKLVEFAKINGVFKDYLTIIPIKERIFAVLLQETLEGIVDVFSQYRIDNYIVDFYIPEVNLIIEYDEKYHTKIMEKDKKRQKFLEEKMKVKFIRVNEGDELSGLNRIIKHMFREKSLINCNRKGELRCSLMIIQD